MNKLKLHPFIIAIFLLCASCQGQKKTNVKKWADVTTASRGGGLNMVADSFTLTNGAVQLGPAIITGVHNRTSTVFMDLDCGTWRDSIYYSEWIVLDTIGTRLIKDKRDWVYNLEDEPLEGNSATTLANYCPCGCRSDSHWFQYRICRLTGIHERRMKTKSWAYTPPPEKPKTEYQMVVDSLKFYR